MSALQKTSAAVLLTLLAAVLYGAWATYQTPLSSSAGRYGDTNEHPPSAADPRSPLTNAPC